MWLFSKVRFKYLQNKKEIIIHGSVIKWFFKLVLMFFKWFKCFPKRLWYSSSTKILSFYLLWYLRETCWFKVNWYNTFQLISNKTSIFNEIKSNQCSPTPTPDSPGCYPSNINRQLQNFYLVLHFWLQKVAEINFSAYDVYFKLLICRSFFLFSNFYLTNLVS